MVELVQLRWEPIAAGVASRVDELPKWIGPASRKGRYWHIPRSAMDFGDRLSIRLWCGAHINYRFVQSGEPPEGLKCGTCSGRFEGTNGIDGLIYSPWDVFATPSLCKGWPDDRGLCVLCGDPCQWWGGSVTRHAPGPEFLERCRPCPDHGWEQVVLRDDRLVCISWVGSGFDACYFDCGPQTPISRFERGARSRGFP